MSKGRNYKRVQKKEEKKKIQGVKERKGRKRKGGH